MFYTPTYKGDNTTVFQTHSGKSIELSQEEMQSLFEVLRSMASIDGSTPAKIEELENKISDLKDRNDRLEDEVNRHDFNDDIKAEIKRKLQDIVEEM